MPGTSRSVAPSCPSCFSCSVRSRPRCWSMRRSMSCEHAELPVDQPLHRRRHLRVDLGALVRQRLQPAPACRPAAPRRTRRAAPRSALTVAVRTLTQCGRVRCSDSTACCSTLLTAAPAGCPIAAPPARSPAHRPHRPCCCARTGRTWRAGSNSTWWPSAPSTRRPVVRAAARLHHHARRLQPGKELAAAWLARASCARSRRSRDQPSAAASRSLQCPTPYVVAIHFGASVSSGCSTQLHFGTRCRPMRGPTLQHRAGGRRPYHLTTRPKAAPFKQVRRVS